jgi:hypothetical protein
MSYMKSQQIRPSVRRLAKAWIIGLVSIALVSCSGPAGLPTESAPPTITPPAIVLPTLTPTLRPNPTATQPPPPTDTPLSPTPTPTPLPSESDCNKANPYRLGKDALNRLGCPVGGERTVYYVTQDFNGGWMLVFDRGDDFAQGGETIFAFSYAGDAWQAPDTFREASGNPDTWYACQGRSGQRPEVSGIPWRGFGKVWCSSGGIQTALGRVRGGSIEAKACCARYIVYQYGRVISYSRGTFAIFAAQGSPGLVAGTWESR